MIKNIYKFFNDFKISYENILWVHSHFNEVA